MKYIRITFSNEDTHHSYNCDTTDLKTPDIRLLLIAFCVAAPTILDQLSITIKSSETINTFRKKVSGDNANKEPLTSCSRGFSWPKRRMTSAKHASRGVTIS